MPVTSEEVTTAEGLEEEDSTTTTMEGSTITGDSATITITTAPSLVPVGGGSDPDLTTAGQSLKHEILTRQTGK